MLWFLFRFGSVPFCWVLALALALALDEWTDEMEGEGKETNDWGFAFELVWSCSVM